MARRIRYVIVAPLLAVALTACTPKVSFWGDSELSVAKADVIAAQNGGARPTPTRVYASPGCGLMPTTSSACHAGTTQTEVDAYWRNAIKSDSAAGIPAMVQIELGINDAYFQSTLTVAAYTKRIERFVGWLPAGVTVLWDNIPAMAPAINPTLDHNAQIVNSSLAKAAAAIPRLHVVDLRAPFAGHWPAWFQSDQLHYNSAGQYEFALLNCHALNAVSAALDPRHVGVDASCDPGSGVAAAVAAVGTTQ